MLKPPPPSLFIRFNGLIEKKAGNLKYEMFKNMVNFQRLEQFNFNFTKIKIKSIDFEVFGLSHV